MFDKIDSVYFILKINLYFTIGNNGKTIRAKEGGWRRRRDLGLRRLDRVAVEQKFNTRLICSEMPFSCRESFYWNEIANSMQLFFRLIFKFISTVPVVSAHFRSLFET